jgi:uncharacterized membrane-anchored protein
LAALLGDVVFQVPRRFFLQQRSGKQNTWFYCASRVHAMLLLLLGLTYTSFIPA